MVDADAGRGLDFLRGIVTDRCSHAHIDGKDARVFIVDEHNQSH